MFGTVVVPKAITQSATDLLEQHGATDIMLTRRDISDRIDFRYDAALNEEQVIDTLHTLADTVDTRYMYIGFYGDLPPVRTARVLEHAAYDRPNDTDGGTQ